MRRDKPILIAVSTPNGRIRCITQTSGVLSYYIQHRLNIRRRASNDTEDFTRRRLLLQRFFEFSEETDVLDCDHGFVGKKCAPSQTSRSLRWQLPLETRVL